MSMPTEDEPAAALASLVGGRVAGARSSLTAFALALEDGRGLLAEARGDGTPVVAVSTPPADALPALDEAGCAVDWSWIAGSIIRGARLVAGRLQLELDPAGPLTVSAALWRGAPFLAFQPYRPRV
ncbi:MAG TPA: hypothetical protein VFB73_10250 [Chloroflexota bacterium]|nr:hypothetical protein [Chloroflexota bacterium]